MVHSGAQGAHKVHISPTFLFVKLETWNLVWMLEFEFHKLSYKPYFERTEVQWCTVVHSGAQWCTVVHSGAQKCTGCTKCTFSPTFLFVKIETWNLAWMLELKFHKLSYTPYFEKTSAHFPTFLFVKLETWNLVWMLEFQISKTFL